MAQLDFNANEVEPTTAYEPLPAGKYLSEISASEMKQTKSGNGSYLELEFTVLDGPCRGRKTWDRLCIDHPNELTQRIARGNLSAICRAVGVLQPRDSVELHHLPMVITVRCKKRKDTGEISNEIKGYAKREVAAGQPPQQTQTQPQQQPPQQTQDQAPANNQTPPWAR